MTEIPDRSGPTALTTSSQTIVTAGGAATWTLVRKLVIANTGNAAVNITVGIGTTNTDTTAKQILPSVTIQPGQSLIEDGFAVLKGHASTPDLLYALLTPAASTGAATIYAALVTGP
jgi:hypothetical protein